MAASVSAWSKPGKWALDAEEHEEELLHQKQPEPPAADFPSLSAAATTKTKKKKNQTLSLAEFSAKATYSAPSQTKTTIFDDAPLSLPSGPREWTAEELDRTKLGGGFRAYGGGRGGEDSSSRWGSGRGSDEGRRFAREPNRESGPSRADEADDWGATKKSTIGNGFDRRDRDRERGSFFDSQSRADDSNNWGSNKSSVPTEARRFGGFERERRGGFEREVSNGGGADSDTWGRKREDSGPVSNGRSRLVLQPRTLPVNPVAANPVSPVSTEKSEAPVIVPKQKTSNPFGQARPREEVLAEKGQDWKEIDEKLETIKIKETVERGERLSFGGGKKSFGSGNGREERSWRKPETDDARPDSRSGSVEGAENGVFEENGREIAVQVTEG